MEFNEKLQELRKNKNLAQEDSKQKNLHFQDMVFGLLDCSVAMYLFLPFFGQRIGDVIHEVSLLSLTQIQVYVKIPYLYDKPAAVCCHVHLPVFGNKGSNADKMGMTRIVSAM